MNHNEALYKQVGTEFMLADPAEVMAKGSELAEQELQSRGPMGCSMEDIKAAVLAYLAGKDHEESFGVFLDVTSRIIGIEKVGIGGLTSVTSNPRILVKRALDLNAAQVVQIHNHPSGVAQSSPGDRDNAIMLGTLLNRLEVTLIDCWVVAGTKIWSLRAEKELDPKDWAKPKSDNDEDGEDNPLALFIKAVARGRS